MIAEGIIYFVLGIVSDVVVTLYYLFVGRLQALQASLMTVFITLLNFFIISKVVISENWILMVFYAAGCALGCFSIVFSQKLKLKNKKNKKKRK